MTGEVTARFGEPDSPPAGTTLTVEVELDGEALGKVTGQPGSIDCEPNCVEQYFDDENVSLVADPEAGTQFTGWEDPFDPTVCVALSPICTVSMDISRLITARFAVDDKYTASVIIEREHPHADGSVTASVGSIDCPGTCSHGYFEDTTVTFTADPDDSTHFWYWHDDEDGACSGTSQTCTVTMDRTRHIHAHFGLTEAPPADTLDIVIQKENEGAHGRVRANYGTIDCNTEDVGNSVCSEEFNHGPFIYLNATPGTDSVFTGWVDLSGGEGCSGTDTLCGLRVDQDLTVVAKFRKNVTDTGPKRLDIIIDRHDTGGGMFGDGQVITSPAGIECGVGTNLCTATFPHNSNVSVFASPRALTTDVNGTFSSSVILAQGSGDSTFWGWEGDAGSCDALDPSCSLVMNIDRTLRAHFGDGTPETLRLGVQKEARNPGADGTVFSLTPLGAINCGSDCSADFFNTLEVTLKATPKSGSIFHHWSDPHCSGQGIQCTLLLDSDKNVVAVFDLASEPQFECSDGIDNDGDGKIDFPDDPGCFGPTDDNETDPAPPPVDCPGDEPEKCPACTDGIDNDGDGTADWAGIDLDDDGTIDIERDLSCQGEPNKNSEGGPVIIEI